MIFNNRTSHNLSAAYCKRQMGMVLLMIDERAPFDAIALVSIPYGLHSHHSYMIYFALLCFLTNSTHWVIRFFPIQVRSLPPQLLHQPVVHLPVNLAGNPVKRMVGVTVKNQMLWVTTQPSGGQSWPTVDS